MPDPFSCAVSWKKYQFSIPTVRDLLMPMKIIAHTPHGSSLLLVSGTPLPHLTTAFFLQDPWRVHQVYQWGNVPLPLSLLSRCAKHYVFLPGPIPCCTNIYPLGDGHKLEGKGPYFHSYVCCIWPAQYLNIYIWISTLMYHTVTFQSMSTRICRWCSIHYNEAKKFLLPSLRKCMFYICIMMELPDDKFNRSYLIKQFMCTCACVCVYVYV